MNNKILFLTACVLMFFACDDGKKFVVEGTIADAKGKTLYIEHTGLLDTEVLDSVKLKENGQFHFSKKRPQYPDFYRLVLDGKYIVFAVDSFETITINSQYQNFAMNYTLEGSPSSVEIQKLRKSLNAIQLSVDSITPEISGTEREKRLECVKKAIETHKDSAKVLILKNAKSAEAYFALHQQVNGMLLFSPYVKEDRTFYNAVATAYHVFMPDYERSKSLYVNAIDALKKKKEEHDRQTWEEIVQQNGVGYIDISLPDRNGTKRALSSLTGKTVLLDFSAFGTPESTDYIFMLRELYDKYSGRGFTIYQVSLDDNKLLWENSVENLPWVCVRDSAGSNASAAKTYNVQSIPALFLLDKKGNIVSRISNLKDLESLIKGNL